MDDLYYPIILGPSQISPQKKFLVSNEVISLGFYLTIIPVMVVLLSGIICPIHPTIAVGAVKSLLYASDNSRM